MVTIESNVQAITSNTIIISVTFRSPGNRRKVSSVSVDVDADLDAISVSKELLDSPELKAVRKLDMEVHTWLYSRVLPQGGFLKAGTYRVPIGLVSRVDDKLTEYLARREALVESFLTVYPDLVEKARSRLRAVFDPANYLGEGAMRNSFAFSWRYFAIETPDSLQNISAALMERESAKARVDIANEAADITLALRQSFADLLAHAVDRLGFDTGGSNKKKRVFRDSLMGNINEFLDLFSARNVMGDVALDNLIVKARKVMNGVDSPDDLRNNDGLRGSVRNSFEAIKREMDDGTMLAPTRKFSFEDEV